MTQTTEPTANHSGGFTLGLVLGTLVGASLGKLLAPQQGSSSNDQHLGFQAERLRKRLRELRESLPQAESSHN